MSTDATGIRRVEAGRTCWRSAAVAGLALGASVLAWGQVMPVKRVRDFKMPEFYEQAAAGSTNRLKSMVTGAEAVPVSGKGDLWALTRVHIESYQPDGRTNLVARAPTCIADMVHRSVSSTGWLEVASANGQLFIEGQGFYLQTTNLHFIISNRVRTVISHELLQRSKR